MKAENLTHPDTPLIEALYTINNPTSFVARGYVAATLRLIEAIWRSIQRAQPSGADGSGRIPGWFLSRQLR